MQGQINIGSKAGDLIKEISELKHINTIIEIGTWNGLGSTRCVLEGLKRKEDYTFLSLECSKSMFELAIKNNTPTNNFKIIHGRIINVDCLDTVDLNSEEKTWIIHDINGMKECPNVMSEIPSSIDFLILDGGEFSTRAEFEVLKDRSNFIFLDDTKCRKNIKNRLELLNSNDFECVADNQGDRNGWSLFKRTNPNK